MNQHILQVNGITKAFAGNKVLDDVSFDIIPGEVHTLIGENGAGKSTLMKIIGGIYTRDRGTVVYDGKEAVFNSPLEAMESGISIVHQELSLAENISVAQNIFCHREPKTNWDLSSGKSCIRWLPIFSNRWVLI